MMHTARIQLVATQGTAGDKLRMRTFIGLQLIGEDGGPVPAEEYAMTLPGGKIVTGTLDATGSAHIGGISAGTCLIAFPQLDQDAWLPVQT